MEVDYNEISEKYDITRTSNPDTVSRLISGAQVKNDSVVVDFGCGTGNFACALKELTNAVIYGIEPSDGMREKAEKKTGDIVFLKGDHTKIPVENSTVDFIYMTDVIHHIPDMTQMFKEFKRILKAGGRVCIVTESHRQIESRFWVRYFPSTVNVEKSRYPDIATIIDTAIQTDFAKTCVDTTDRFMQHALSRHFVKLVENKGFSMFSLISDGDYEAGLASLRKDFESQTVLKYTHGETFIWLEKI